jgi:NADH-quinone oxidoreductase subunit M
MDFPILSAIMLAPGVGLLVILFLPHENKTAVRWVSLLSAGVSLSLTLFIYATYDTASGGLQFAERVLWVKSLGIYYFLAVDGISLPMVLLTSIVFFTGVWTMWDLEKRVKEFFALMLLMVLGVYGVFMALDLFFLFVFYDVSLVPHVSPHRHLGFHPQGIRRAQTDPLPPGGIGPGPAGHSLCVFPKRRVQL